MKALLEEKGMSQKEVADALGVSPVVVFYWANGKSYPRPDKLLKLEELLGVPAGDIIRAITETKDKGGGNEKNACT